jgi:hypothetical protein
MRSISCGRRARAASAALQFIAAFGAPASAQDWKTFTSDKGFSLQYPADWIPTEKFSASELGIKSEPGGQNGVSIKAGQAEIFVLREGDIRALSDASAKWKSDEAPVISRRLITNGKGDCRRAKEIVSAFDFGGPTGTIPQYQHTILCENAGTVIVLELIHWADDKNQTRWQQIANRMLAGLRVRN